MHTGTLLELRKKAGLVLQPTTNSTQPYPQATSEIVNLLIAMKNNGKSPYTLKATSKTLKEISKHADLHSPNQVKTYIANKNVCRGTQNNYCIIYNSFCRHYKIKWEMPIYKPEPKHITIPTSERLEMLIASAGKTLQVRLRISKETGIRPLELCNLKVKDIDLEHRLIKPTTAKNGNPRTLKISQSLQNQIQDYVVRKDLKPNDKLFKGTADTYTRLYIRHRNVLAKKLKDPTLNQIRLYDFRHYFATMLYHKTKDILYVNKKMGHKRIETTLIYTQLLETTEDEWTCKATANTKEAQDLIEHGFTYILTTPDKLMLFRKRK